jgi:hypothetical protein
MQFRKRNRYLVREGAQPAHRPKRTSQFFFGAVTILLALLSC